MDGINRDNELEALHQELYQLQNECMALRQDVMQLQSENNVLSMQVNQLNMLVRNMGGFHENGYPMQNAINPGQMRPGVRGPVGRGGMKPGVRGPVGNGMPNPGVRGPVGRGMLNPGTRGPVGNSSMNPIAGTMPQNTMGNMDAISEQYASTPQPMEHGGGDTEQLYQTEPHVSSMAEVQEDSQRNDRGIRSIKAGNMTFRAGRTPKVLGRD